MEPIRERQELRLVIAFALGLAGGFVPACLYAATVRDGEIRPNLVEQAAISARSATRTAAETHARREALTAQGNGIRTRAAAVILMLWAVSGAGIGWGVLRATRE